MATLTRAESLAILSGGAKGKSTPAMEQNEEKQNGSQSFGGAVMSREESLKILSEGAAGTYKPKNETVSNSPQRRAWRAYLLRSARRRPRGLPHSRHSARSCKRSWTGSTTPPHT